MLEGAFNQQKAILQASFVIVKTDCETDGLSAALENRNIRNPPTWRDIGAVACAGNYYVGLVRGVEGFTRAGKDI